MTKTPTFTHIDSNNQATMVDVSQKLPIRRTAKALSLVALPEKIMALLQEGDIQGKKGPVFQTAILSGIMGAKKTSDLIPLCHPIALEDCAITITKKNDSDLEILCSVVTTHKTGVEMEALTGASVAALTVYDMCKALSSNITIKETRLLEKTKNAVKSKVSS